MADGARLVLCNPLCFLVNKYSSTQSKMLKSALLDFYIDEELSTAKQQLLKDFNDVCQGEQVKIGTHIPLRIAGWRGGLVVERRTCDLVVAGSRPNRDAAAQQP